MFKNVASQKFTVFAFDSTTNLPKTGDAANISAYISKDNGSVTQLGDTSATEMDATNAKGYYLFDATQAETNADQILLTGKSSTSNIVVVGAPAMIYTDPANFTALSIDSSGNVKISAPIKKGAAISKFEFLMTDSTNHNPATGKTVTCTRSIDGGTFSAGTLGTPTELSNGAYYVDFGTGDTNGSLVMLRCVASGCDDLMILIPIIP